MSDFGCYCPITGIPAHSKTVGNTREAKDEKRQAAGLRDAVNLTTGYDNPCNPHGLVG